MDAAMSKDDDFEYSFGGRFLAPLWRFLSRFVTNASPNPTENWVRSSSVQMILDLDNNVLAGIPMNVSYKELSVLGPCDEFTGRVYAGVIDDINSTETESHSFLYLADGIGFGADESWNIDGFHIHLKANPEEPSSCAFTGKVVWKGQAIALHDLTDAESVIRIFGTPDIDTRKMDLGKFASASPPWSNSFLHYARPKATWSICVDETDRTEWFSITTTPLGLKASGQSEGGES